HTMVLTVDTTWRWSRFTRILGASDTLYARFWSQTVRRLAGQSNDDKQPRLTVSTDQVGYDAGKQVQVKVVRQARPDIDLTKAKPRVSFENLNAGGKPLSVPVRNSSAHPDTFTGTFYPAAPGRYTVNAELKSESKKYNKGSEFVVHGSSQELLNTGTNSTNLEE